MPSNGGPAVAMGLPRPTSLTQALLGSMSRGEPGAVAVTAIRDRVVRQLGELAAELPGSEHVRIDAFRTTLALRRPEQCASFDSRPFSPSPRACRRAIGVAAVSRCVRGLARTPSTAVSEVLDAGVEDVARDRGTGAVRAPWWAAWYAQLPLGGRAAVEAEAVTWATQLFTALEWRRFDRPPVIAGRDDWWQAPGGRLVLQGRAEVRAQLEERCAFLVVAGGSCGEDWRVRLGFPALVCLLARGERALPCRVVGIWPASGQTRLLALDGPSLDEVARAVVAATATWVGARTQAAASVRAV